MNSPQLAALRRRYPAAPHSYFVITNYKAAFERFMQGTDENPQFTYRPSFTMASLTKRCEDLNAQLQQETEPAIKKFLEQRIVESEFLCSFLRLVEKPGDEDLLHNYRQFQQQLFGQFDANVLFGIIAYLQQRAQPDQQEILAYILQHVASQATDMAQLVLPRDDVFTHYKQLLFAIEPDLTELCKRAEAAYEKGDSQSIMDLIGWALQVVKADEAGWEATRKQHAGNVMVSKHKQKVRVGEEYSPKSSLRLAQIVAHEVFVHVRRYLEGGNGANEEGVAILVEQLLGDQFVYKRSMRYLAACLAWGVDGQPRTFRETYEIVWRAFVILSNTSEADAKERAFKECSRIFRGGIPAVAGAAFIKDKVYLEANLAVWQQLIAEPMDQKTFCSFLRGTL